MLAQASSSKVCYEHHIFARLQIVGPSDLLIMVVFDHFRIRLLSGLTCFKRDRKKYLGEAPLFFQKKKQFCPFLCITKFKFNAEYCEFVLKSGFSVTYNGVISHRFSKKNILQALRGFLQSVFGFR